MTNPYYECHITMMCDKGVAERAVNVAGWTFSAIDNDIVLGEGIKCYATKHFNMRRHQYEVMDELDRAAAVISDNGAKVIRKKIENVIYDERING